MGCSTVAFGFRDDMNDRIYAWFLSVFVVICGIYAVFRIVYSSSESESVVDKEKEAESEAGEVGDGGEEEGVTEVVGVREVSGTGDDGTFTTFLVHLRGASLRSDVRKDPMS